VAGTIGVTHQTVTRCTLRMGQLLRANRLQNVPPTKTESRIDR
jgi:hypothetical protein